MAQRKLDADPLLNPRMKRHLKRLEMKNVAEYREWCRKHKFKASLSKNHLQLDNELLTKQKEKKAEAINAELMKHLRLLGFETIDEYRGWCRSAGLSESPYKSTAQREKEVQFKRRSDFDGSLKKNKNAERNFSRLAGEILSDKIDSDSITNPELRHVCWLVRDMATEAERKKLFIRLLMSVIPKADFLDLNPVIDHFGRTRNNTLIDGLYAMSGHSHQWIRAPESWNPDHKSLHKRFSELARHLFASYPVPGFMDSAWFAGAEAGAFDQQQWFIHIGQGGNIRTAAGLPMQYTKKMAHLFIQAPDNFTVVHALRWGQVSALGGSKDLVAQINSTPVGERLENEQFWDSVIHFFANNPMLDLSYVGPIIDYIYHRKFNTVQVARENGVVEEIDPPDPGFSMKGRKAGPLLALVDEWHRTLAKEKRKLSGTWDSSGIPPYEYIEEEKTTKHVIKWTITELLTRKDVIEEGRVMKHCVGSYVPSCAKGAKSVWSLRRENKNTNSRRHVLTIAVKNNIKKIVEARGKCNAVAGIRPGSREQAQTLLRDEEALEAGRRVMEMWGEENELSVPRYS